MPISCIASQYYSRNSSARLTVGSPAAPSQHACSRRGLPLTVPRLLRSSSLAPSSVLDPSRLWFVAPVASGGWICLLGSAGPLMDSCSLRPPHAGTRPRVGIHEKKKKDGHVRALAPPLCPERTATTGLPAQWSILRPPLIPPGITARFGRNPPASSKDLWPFSHHSSRCFTWGCHVSVTLTLQVAAIQVVPRSFHYGVTGVTVLSWTRARLSDCASPHPVPALLCASPMDIVCLVLPPKPYLSLTRTLKCRRSPSAVFYSTVEVSGRRDGALYECPSRHSPIGSE